MSLPLFQVDAFAPQPFSGNPAAVCILSDQRTDNWLQDVASEMNLSETAFVRSLDGEFELRWFTPTQEVDLCGHATLATAHVLWQEGLAEPSQPIKFQTRSGVLTAAFRDDLIELDFPRTRVEPCPPPPGLLEALGADAEFVGRSCFDFLVELENESALRALQPNFAELSRIETRGVIATCRSSNSEFDFMSRFFAPSAGVNEDPVCGSAHCSLADFWSQRLGKDTMLAYQASERGGVVRVRVVDERVFLGGTAVTVLKGKLVAAVVKMD